MSGKHGALYAKVHRRGTWREHQLAGARLGRVGVRLSFTIPYGWQATVYIGRVSVQVTKGIPDNHPRLRAFFTAVFPPESRVR